MKIVQSFWSGNQTDFTNTYGWSEYKHNWMSWLLSCHQLVKYHKEVELYTDAFGYEILINKLKLPYTKVHVVLDELNHYDKNLWALAKIKTFQLQTAPFLHVDGDVFVWESLTDKFKNSNLVAQNLENTLDYCREKWEAIQPQLLFLPAEMKPYNDRISDFSCNMGIIGGNNLDFFKHYTKKSMEFAGKNATCIKDLDTLNFNLFFEQVLFHEISKTSNEKIDFYYDNLFLTPDYEGFADFDKVPYKKYLHFMSNYKKNSIRCKAMETYVMRHYPEAYSNLTQLINEVSKDNTEITFLDTNKVKQLLSEFDIELRTSNFKEEHFLLKRDLYNEGLPNKFENFLNQNQNFWMAIQNGFERKKITLHEKEMEFLEIEEINCNPKIYPLDDIDEIILSIIVQPIRYLDFIEKIKTNLEEEDDESINEFVGLINKTLRNYLTLKIINIYTFKKEKITVGKRSKDMNLYKKITADLTVILNIWKREHLEEQLISLINQTVIPKEVWILHYEDKVHTIDIIERYKKHLPYINLIQSNKNLKYFGRFSIAINVTTKFTWIIDDDVIPGCRWIENCIEKCEELNAIITCTGRIIPRNNFQPERYFDAAYYIGDIEEHSLMNICKDDTIVDYACNSYFFQTKWISTYWSIWPATFLSGEDIHLSATCKSQLNVNTVVLKQDNEETTGNLNRSYGRDENASWKQNDFIDVREKVFRHHILKHNWPPMEWKMI